MPGISWSSETTASHSWSSILSCWAIPDGAGKFASPASAWQERAIPTSRVQCHFRRGVPATFRSFAPRCHFLQFVQVRGSYPQTHDGAILESVRGRLPLTRPEAQHHAEVRRGSRHHLLEQGRLSPFQVSTARALSIPACAIRAFISAIGYAQVISR